MDARDVPDFAALAARLDELGQVCARLSRENAELRDRVSQLDAGPMPAPTGNGGLRHRGTPDGKVSRRRAMGRAVGAAAAGVVGAVALTDASASPAAAANGDAITAGKTTSAEAATTVLFDGVNDPGVIFLVNDDPSLIAGISGQSSALGGWASISVPNGVYGFSQVNGGNGVVGVNQATTGNAVHGLASASGVTAVLGENTAGTAVAGTSGSTAPGATAIIGTITSTSPGTTSTGVRGINKGTSGHGIGVWGSHAGSGWGVDGTSSSGIGVRAFSGSGTGVSAGGAIGVSAEGSSQGAVISGPTAVKAFGLGVGVNVSAPTAVLAFGSIVGVSASAPTAVFADGAIVGVSASGETAVQGNGKNIGLLAAAPTAVQATATGTAGVGINAGGSGNGGRGGTFSGAAAQVQLAPGSLATHPKSGKRGDLYADKTGRLWFCKTGGNTATWHQIA